MARPCILSTSDASGGAKYSGIYVVDTWVESVEISLACDVTGTVDFDVEYTLDDPFSASAKWWTHSGIDGDTADVVDFIAFPCTGVRLLQNSGSGSVRMVVLQSGGGSR